MTSIKFVCLANSRRNGESCVAGLILDSNGNITKDWIRPIGKQNHTIPEADAKDIMLLSVVELIGCKKVKKVPWRPEDYYYEELRPKETNKTVQDLIEFANNDSELISRYANSHYYPKDSDKEPSIKNLQSSLALVRATIIGINKSKKKIHLEINSKTIEKQYTGKKRIEKIQKLSGKEVLVIISIVEDHYEPPDKTIPPLHYKLIAEIFNIDKSTI